MAIFTVVGLIALIFPIPIPIRFALSGLYMIGNGTLLGGRLLPNESAPWRSFFGSLALLAALITGGAGLYYIYRLDFGATLLLLSLAPLLLSAASRRLIRNPNQISSPTIVEPAVTARSSKNGSAQTAIILPALMTAVMALLALAAAILANSATELSIRSPWDVVPRTFLAAIFLAAIGALAASMFNAVRGFLLIPLAGISLLATGVAAKIYTVGFGFDPFIHQATEKVIAQLGVIKPKPLYYIGQYALVGVLNRLSGIDVVTLDKTLLPIAAIIIAPCAYWSLKKTLRVPAAIAGAASFGTLLLPLASFIVTTPQGLANLLLLITALLALPAIQGEFPLFVLGLFCSAAIATHPLAGIPLAVFLAILFCYAVRGQAHHEHKKTRRPILAIVLLGAIALPALFAVNSWLSGFDVSLRWPGGILEDLRSPGAIMRRFDAIYDFIYFWQSIGAASIAAAAVIGIFFVQKRKLTAAVYGLSLAVFFVNYLLLKYFIAFPFLIAYERSNYADRLSDLMIFLMAPLALAALAAALNRLWRGYAAVKIGVAVIFAGLIASSIYLAYPRRDEYESSRGWSTSAADVKAVRLINRDAGDARFVALANQAVSAAAMREFGFKSYYRSRDTAVSQPIFYYPIPTGGPLYQNFIEMNDASGSYAVARKTMDSVGVDVVYYVVNNYWYRARQIITLSRGRANAWWDVDGQNFVFKYVRKDDSKK